VKTRAVLAGLLGAATIAGAGTLVAATGTTFASYSSTMTSSPSVIGSAAVELGHGGAGPELGFSGLGPGHPQTVNLSVQYVGSIPADLTLSVAPGPGPVLCEKVGAGWQARPGAAVTLAVGSADPVAYCSLYSGAPLTLARAAAPGSTTVVPVTLALSADASPAALGLAQHDLAVIHADGGFTDRADGRLDLTTAEPPAGSPDSGIAAPILAAGPGAPATTVGADTVDPAAAARTAAPGTPVAIPAECAAAGMSAADFAEIVTVDPARHAWSVPQERGAGSGPFLILGTAGDDTIVGSSGADCIVGGGGDDTISGGDGNDVIVGGSGADTLSGGAGDDHLYGGGGLDDLRGGDGADVLDSGPGGATCDATPADTATGCIPPVTTTPSPAPVTAPPTPAPDPAPAPTAPSAPTTTVEPAPVTPPTKAPATVPAAPPTATG
jgi:hypothetical protein